MPGEEETDTSRKTVKTFVPAYQKSEWKRHADDLDMSQSEFVRTMVQAGRRDFDIESPKTPQSSPTASGTDGAASGSGNGSGGDSTGSEEGVNGADVESQILSVLSASDYLSWEQLVEELTNDIEDRLDRSIQQLQAENRVRYSGRHGGYALLAGDDGD